MGLCQRSFRVPISRITFNFRHQHPKISLAKSTHWGYITRINLYKRCPPVVGL